MRYPGRERMQRGVDVALPIALTLLLLAVVLDASDGLAAGLVLIGVLGALAQGAAVWGRRPRPERALLLALVGGVAVELVAPETLFPYAGIVVLFTFTSVRPPRRSLPALAAVLAVTALAFIDQPHADVLFAMAFPIIAWALGEAARNRRVAISEGARRAVTEEQARIARELHDIIAHSVSVMVVQAAAADDVFDEDPAQARRALRAIESAGRDTLGELRRLLAAVRPGGAATDAAELAPQPGLARLPDLAATLRAAGLEVTVHQDDLGDRVAAGIDLSAYRIVQEALTNTLRHAGARRAVVTVGDAGGVLDVEVRDDGRGLITRPSPDGPGRGIAGMRERAAMLGGSLEAGPHPDGGFRVHASLPLTGAP